MESRVCFNKNAKDSDKFKKIQIIEFYWFNAKIINANVIIVFVFKKRRTKKILEMENVLCLVSYFLCFNNIGYFVVNMQITR